MGKTPHEHPSHAQAAPRHAHAPAGMPLDTVDPGYWPRATGLRVVIAIMYFALIPAGLLPMSTAWWLASGGGLLVWAVAMFAMIMLRPKLLWPHVQISPFLDVAFVTLAIIALAKPDYPIWIGYTLIISSLSAVHSSRYVLAFSAWTIIALWAGGDILIATERADVEWQLWTVVSIMAAFTALNADVITTSNRKLRDMVLESSLTDPLTGLANRRRFRQVLDSHAAPEVHPLAVLMYDIDNFKQINEERGHVHADGVLVQIADSLRETLRGADTIARYGGDELIVLAHVNDVDEAVLMGERSLEHVRERLGVTLSAGLAVYPITAATLEAAVHDADAALGRAKHSGKARLSVAA